MPNTATTLPALLKDYEARDSFRDFLSHTLIGPGTDLLAGADPIREQLAELPLRRYYSGVLFPRPTAATTTGQMEGVDTQDEDGNEDEADENDQKVEDQLAAEETTDDEEAEEKPEELTDNSSTTQEQRSWTQNTVEYPAANQFFPDNMGLTCCVAAEVRELTIELELGIYVMLDPTNTVGAEQFRIPFPGGRNVLDDLFAADGFPDSLRELVAYDEEHHYLTLTRPVSGQRGAGRTGDYADLETFKRARRENRKLVALPHFERLFYPRWQRHQVQLSKTLVLADAVREPIQLNAADGFTGHATAQLHTKVLPRGACNYVKVLLANTSHFEGEKLMASSQPLNELCFFQTTLRLRVPAGATLLSHQPISEQAFDDEARTLRYLYRDVHSYGQGHSCAVQWENIGKGAMPPARPTWLATTWLPQVTVPGMSNDLRDRDELTDAVKRAMARTCELKRLSVWSELTAEETVAELLDFAGQYKIWLDAQATEAHEEEKRRDATSMSFANVLEPILQKQQDTYDRLVRNIELLNEPEAMTCFQLANTAMLMQMVVSDDPTWGNTEKEPNLPLPDGAPVNLYRELDSFENHPGRRSGDGHAPFQYRPFQLAFLLLNLEAIVDPTCANRREVVDLLWFPTGGGKTEAYLALAAFTIAWRRRSSPAQSGGTSVLMRYTLRLLASQQFERAARLICALDMLRLKLPQAQLGTERISIGLWVGGSSTPNRLELGSDSAMSCQNEMNQTLANNRNPPATRLEGARDKNRFALSACPWCGSRLFGMHHATGRPVHGFEVTGGNNGRFAVRCLDERCFFRGSPMLPIDVVDDSLYRHPPTLLFATVDKFAQLAHREEGYRFFGLNQNGRTPQRPPDLIIQDELHLLSGPLGSVVGLFEAAVELLATRDGIAPKIVASTATTRNTEQQIAALYGGRQVAVFPPTGIRYDDSFFAKVSTGRRVHIGFMPTGKTGADTQVRVQTGLLAQRALLMQQLAQQPGWLKLLDNYWTLVVYFNNLKDLGKSYNQVGAEVADYLRLLHARYGLDSQQYRFAYQGLLQRTRELTSRIDSARIKDALKAVEVSFPVTKPQYDPDTRYFTPRLETVDLVLASNMLSVGIDVERFNLMLMVGQPKVVAEYIQASSRVARKVAGLVVNLLNPNRAREKSYFENYVAFNQAYYRYVEPLSVTPYTDVTLDKALSTLLVAYVRQRAGGIPGKAQAGQFTPTQADGLREFLSQRITEPEQRAHAQQQLDNLVQDWQQQAAQNSAMTYRDGLIKPVDSDSPWALMTSMREIDTTTIIQMNPA